MEIERINVASIENKRGREIIHPPPRVAFISYNAAAALAVPHSCLRFELALDCLAQLEVLLRNAALIVRR
jgi:hypothetical protein